MKHFFPIAAETATDFHLKMCQCLSISQFLTIMLHCYIAAVAASKLFILPPVIVISMQSKNSAQFVDVRVAFHAYTP